jgi:hypothetical protein
VNDDPFGTASAPGKKKKGGSAKAKKTGAARGNRRRLR